MIYISLIADIHLKKNKLIKITHAKPICLCTESIFKIKLITSGQGYMLSMSCYGDLDTLKQNHLHDTENFGFMFDIPQKPKESSEPSDGSQANSFCRIFFFFFLNCIKSSLAVFRFYGDSRGVPVS